MDSIHTVLFVDDEPNVLSALRRLVRREGYEVLTATSGAEGLQVLQQHPVAVIMSDQRMPGMIGARFLAESIKLAPHAIRIMLTGYSDVEAATQAINEGEIYRFVTKPWDDENLRVTLREAVDRYDLEGRNRLLTAELSQKSDDLERLNRHLEDKIEQRTAQLWSTLEEKQALTQSLQFKIKELEGRDRIARHLLEYHDLDDTLQTVVAVITESLGLERAVVYVLEAGEFRPVATNGASSSDLSGSGSSPLHRKSFATVRDTLEPVNVAETAGPFAVVPVLRGTDFLGLIEAGNESRPVSDEQMSALISFALQAAVAISDAEAQRSMDEWRDDLDRMLEEAGGIDQMLL